MPQFGKSVHWARERYYGGTFVTDADLYWVNARVNDESEIEHAGKLQRYAAAVDLSPTAFSRLAPLGRGVLAVTISEVNYPNSNESSKPPVRRGH